MEDSDMEDSDAPGLNPKTTTPPVRRRTPIRSSTPRLPHSPHLRPRRQRRARATRSQRTSPRARRCLRRCLSRCLSRCLPMPPPTSQPTSQPMSQPMPPPPSIAPEHPRRRRWRRTARGTPGDAEASAMASAMEDPWVVCEPVIHRRPAPVGDAEGTEANEGFGAGPETDPGAGLAREGAADGASEIPRTVRPFARDADLDAALNLCEKPWTELTVAETHLILRQVKRLIARRGRARERRRRRRRPGWCFRGGVRRRRRPRRCGRGGAHGEG